jgi:hypothetical protein
MKIRFRNFNRGEDQHPWIKNISGELIRKPKYLVAWEFLQFILAVLGSAMVYFYAASWEHWVLIGIPASYLAAALLLAFDNPLYRAVSLLSVLASIVFLLYLGSQEGNTTLLLIPGGLSGLLVQQYVFGTQCEILLCFV